MPSDVTKDLFAEIREAESTRKIWPACSIRDIIESMSPADAESLTKAFDDPSIKGTTITKVLKGRGFNISSHTVQRHRRNGCSCQDNREN